MFTIKTLLHHLFPILLLPSLTSAHGRIVNITTFTGKTYPGFDPSLALDNPSLTAPQLAAWSASNLGNIYVTPSSYNTSDINCHFDSHPGALHVNVTSGETLTLQWNEWPISHKGPVMTYIASCGDGSCAKADKERLKWVKIEGLGWLNSTNWELGLGGTWASDVLIAQGYRWEVEIPKGLATGGYVIRHEIIALHVAEALDGAQSYPQCVNVWVGGGGGTKRIEGGVLGNRLYTPTDKGILVNIHENITGYEIPGPKVWKG